VLAYITMALAFVVAYLMLPNVPARKNFFLALALAGALAPFFYALCPAAGPVNVTSNFPYSIPPALAPQAQPVSKDIMLNAMPSLHIAWGLLIVLFLKPYGRRLAAWSGVYLALTIVATLATGEHYMIDLIVGVPYAFGVFALVCRRWFLGGGLLALVASVESLLRNGRYGTTTSLLFVAAFAWLAGYLWRSWKTANDATPARRRRFNAFPVAP